MNSVNKLLNSLASKAPKRRRRRGRGRKGGKGNKRATMNARGSAFRMAGKDLVQILPASVVEGTGYFGFVTANPAYWMGTRISAIASAYQSYDINRIAFEYVPQVSVGYNGTVIMGTIWDNSQTSSMTQQSLYTSPGGKMTVVYQGCTTTVPLSGLQRRRFNMSGDLTVSTNPFFFLAAVRGGFLAFQEQGDKQVVPGYFVVHYDYTFYNPIGAGWKFDVQYGVTLDQVTSRLHTSLVNITPVPPYGSGTVFDYDGNQASLQGTVVKFKDPGLLFNSYSSGPINSYEGGEPEDDIGVGAITGTKRRRKVTAVEYLNSNNEWVAMQPYSSEIGQLLNTARGFPGLTSVILYNQLGDGLDADGVPRTNYYHLATWSGIREWSLSSGSLQYGYYFFSSDPLQNLTVRVRFNRGTSSYISPDGFNVLHPSSYVYGAAPNSLFFEALDVDIDFDLEPEPIENLPSDPQPVYPPLDPDLDGLLGFGTGFLGGRGGDLVNKYGWEDLSGRVVATDSGGGLTLTAGGLYLIVPKAWPAVMTPVQFLEPQVTSLVTADGPARYYYIRMFDVSADGVITPLSVWYTSADVQHVDVVPGVWYRVNLGQPSSASVSIEGTSSDVPLPTRLTLGINELSTARWRDDWPLITGYSITTPGGTSLNFPVRVTVSTPYSSVQTSFFTMFGQSWFLSVRPTVLNALD